jgi:hypothetical protein
MRRLARHLFTLCSVVSLLVCIAAVVFAMRGVWRSDWVNYAGSRHTLAAASIGSTGWYTYSADASKSRHGLSAGTAPRIQPYFTRPPDNWPHLLGLTFVRGSTAPTPDSAFGGNRFYLTLLIPTGWPR